MLSAHLPCISSILLFLSLSLSQHSWQKNQDQHSRSKPMWLPIIFAILLLFLYLYFILTFFFFFFSSRGKGVPPFRIPIYSNFKYNGCIIVYRGNSKPYMILGNTLNTYRHTPFDWDPWNFLLIVQNSYIN